MRNSGIVWTQDTLDQFLRSPMAMVPGTSMGIAGIFDPQQRRQLIRYLGTLNNDNPQCR